MELLPATRASLLIRIRDPQDAEAWRQFVQLYGSVVYGFGRRRGLQDADAADLMQDVFRAIALAAGRLEYDPRRGSFRAWLFTVTRSKLYNFLNGQRRQFRASGDSEMRQLLDESTAPPELEAQWEQEYQQRVLAWAAEQIRSEFQEKTWRAFWLTAVEQRHPSDAAAQLGMSVGAVYVARSRVLTRLKDQVRQAQDGDFSESQQP
jgi:RNA polymerase sigma-70 factor (ECF subfamily)